MPELNIIGLLRGSLIVMPAGFVLLIGGVVAITAGTTVVGGVLLGLAVVGVSVGCLLMFRARSRVGAVSRDARGRRQAQSDAASRDDQG